MYRKANKWISSTTAHGISHAVRSENRFIKWMWVLFFLTSVSYCSYTIVNSVVDYLNYETTVKIQIGREFPTYFPAVTICNMNTFFIDIYGDMRNSYFSKLLIKQKMYSQLATLDPTIETTFEQQPIKSDQLIKLKRLIAIDKTLNETQRKQLGYNLQKHMLISCIYNKRLCNASDFSSFWHDYYGNCYTFNGNNKNETSFKTTNTAGPDYGLRIELLVGNSVSSQPFLKRSGVFLSVHNNSHSPLLASNSIIIPTGTETYISVSRTFNLKLPHPYSNCIQELKPFNTYSTKLFGYITQLNVNNYTSEFCYKICYQDKLIHKCNCSDITIPSIRNSLACYTDDQLKCLGSVDRIFSSSNIEELCEHSCPPECLSIKYDLFDHKSTFPTEYYFSELMINSPPKDTNVTVESPFDIIGYSFRNYFMERDKSLQNLRDILLKITINYNDLRSTYQTEIPNSTFETLLGVLGGQLGLFIGISFLSVLEIIELLIEVANQFFKVSRKRIEVYNIENQNAINPVVK